MSLSERRAWIGLPADDDQPVDPSAEQGPQLMLLADGVAACVAQEDAHLAGPEGVLGPHQDRDDEPALEVARQQPDGPVRPASNPWASGLGLKDSVPAAS